MSEKLGIRRLSRVVAPATAAVLALGVAGCDEPEHVDPTISHIQQSDIEKTDLRYVTPGTAQFLGNISSDEQLLKLLDERQKEPNNTWYDYNEVHSIDETPRRFSVRLYMSGRNPRLGNDGYCEKLKVAEGVTKIAAVAIANSESKVLLSWPQKEDGAVPEVTACLFTATVGLPSPEIVAFAEK